MPNFVELAAQPVFELDRKSALLTNLPSQQLFQKE
jgi:hypothetical protein